MKMIDNIITKVSTKYGAPQGRCNVGTPSKDATIFDCLVPMSSCGAYDKGGVYWGIGEPLRVRYTKDLSYIEFYRTTFEGWMIKQHRRVLGAYNYRSDKSINAVYRTYAELQVQISKF